MGGMVSRCFKGGLLKEGATSCGCGRSAVRATRGRRPSTCEIEKLSPDLKLEIAKRSGAAGAFSLSRVSKDWYEVTRSQSLWESLYPSEVPHRLSEDWRALMVERSSLAKEVLGPALNQIATKTPEMRIVFWQMQFRHVQLSAEGILRLVDALADAKRYTEAIEWFKKLEKDDPGAISVHCDVWRYAERGHTPLLEVALNGGHVEIGSRDRTHGSTPLMFAAQEGKVESLRFLLSKGANVTAVSLNYGQGALDFALEAYGAPDRSSPHFNIAEELIIGGLPVDHRTSRNGMTTLMHAAQWGKLKTVWFLLHRGADVNAREVAPGQPHWGGRTALDFALNDFHSPYEGSRPHLYVVQALVLAGAPVDYGDRKWGSTPLMFAARWGDVALPRLLISRGADVHASNRKSNAATALKFALVSHKGWGPHLKVVEALIEGGVSVDAAVCTADVSGLTSLMIAAQEGDAEAVAFLIDRGADVNLVDEKNSTALDYALVLHNGHGGPHRGVAYQLLAAGAVIERAKHHDV